MKALSLTFGATVLACGSSPCGQTPQSAVASFSPAAPASFSPAASASFSGSFVGSSTAQFQQVSQPVPYQQYQPTGSFVGGANFGSSLPSFGGSAYGQGQLLGVSYSPFSANKPWQQQQGSGAVSNWVNSPSSVWTPTGQSPTPAPAKTPRAPNPALAGRSPSEQLQITKCRSAQSCEKCRQLNCYWDVNAKVTNRCIALGLESTQIPVDAGQAANLGYCPTSGQPGFVGVNWLAIENSGAAVPNLDGMSDSSVQQWLSSIPNYNPDGTDSNYPAGTAFQDLLPSAAAAYASGKIPSTTPWVSFFDSNLNGGGYNYDGYYDSGYSYDLPSGGASGLLSGGSGSFTGGNGGAYLGGSSGWGSSTSSFGGSSFTGGAAGLGGWNSGSSFDSSSNFGSFGGLGGGSSLANPYGSFQGTFQGSFGPSTTAYSGSSYPSFAAPSAPATSGFSGFSSTPMMGSGPASPSFSGSTFGSALSGGGSVGAPTDYSSMTSQPVRG